MDESEVIAQLRETRKLLEQQRQLDREALAGREEFLDAIEGLLIVVEEGLAGRAGTERPN